MKSVEYITQLTKSDLKRILTGETIKAGDCVEITQYGDGIQISVNQSQFKRWVYAFYHNGGFSAAVSDIDSISLDF